MNLDDIRPIVHEIALFGGLTDEQLEIVVNLLRESSHESGEIIFEKGSKASNIYIIKSGRVRIFSETDGPKPFEIVAFNVGDCFGEISVIGIIPHTGTAQILEPTELIVLSRQALMHLYKSDARTFASLILNIAREACRRLSNTNQMLLHYVNQSGSSKINSNTQPSQFK